MVPPRPLRAEDPAGAVPRLAALTWFELRDLAARGRSLGLLPVGAIEAHGPHLPLGTDCLLAEAMADAGARELSAAGWDPVVLPTWAWTPAPFARDLPGTIDVAPGAARAALGDVVAAAARWGLVGIVLVNVHHDPAHVKMLRDLVAVDLDLPVCFPDLTRRRWADRLGEDFRRGCHAGRWETSLVLARDPGAVRADVAAGLRPSPVSLVEAIAAGRRSFAAAGAPDAWVGDPASARSDHGHAQLAILGRIVADAVAADLGAPAGGGEPMP